MGHYVYKYVDDGEIIYIGKSKNLLHRISEHKSEFKFKQHPNAEIFYTSFANTTEMDAIEKVLINQYKPILNVTDKMEGCSLPDMDAFIWKPLSDFPKPKQSQGNKRPRPISHQIRYKLASGKSIHELGELHGRDTPVTEAVRVMNHTYYYRDMFLKKWLDVCSVADEARARMIELSEHSRLRCYEEDRVFSFNCGDNYKLANVMLECGVIEYIEHKARDYFRPVNLFESYYEYKNGILYVYGRISNPYYLRKALAKLEAMTYVEYWK